jgi:hypothetical protein
MRGTSSGLRHWFFPENRLPATGLEPVHPCGRQILSLLRLPISPRRLISVIPARIAALYARVKETGQRAWLRRLQLIFGPDFLMLYIAE